MSKEDIYLLSAFSFLFCTLLKLLCNPLFSAQSNQPQPSAKLRPQSLVNLQRPTKLVGLEGTRSNRNQDPGNARPSPAGEASTTVGNPVGELGNRAHTSDTVIQASVSTVITQSKVLLMM